MFLLAGGKHAPAASGSLPSVFASVGLNLSDFEMNSNTSELVIKLYKLLTGNSDADALGNTAAYKSSP